MSKIGELLDQLAANKRATDELEAAIAATGEVVDQIAAQLSNLGAAGKAQQVQQVQTQLADARNTRWLSEGHLEDAIMVLQSAIDGQKGIGTSLKNLPTTTPNAGGPKAEHGPTTAPPNSTTYTTDIDGQKVDITLVSPEPEHEPGPSGGKLVEESEDDDDELGTATRLSRTGVRRIDDIQDQARETGDVIGKLASKEPAPQELEAVEIQDVSPSTDAIVAQVPQPPVSWVDAAVQGLTLGIGAVEAMTRAKRRKSNDR